MISLSVIVPSCRSTQVETSIYWYDTGYQIVTNDISRLQKEVPFTIILPTYIPGNNTQSELPELTWIPEPASRNGVELKIWYNLRMFFREELPIRGHINEDLEPLYLNIKGIQVLQMKGTTGIPTDDEYVFEPTLYYHWNANDVDFSATFISLDASEAVKVVESMIK
jgi:hypothetical protein